MIPNIFISSTITDLHYLRDAVRDQISSFCYNPILSEYGDIGYLPNLSVIESCNHAMSQSQLAVFIIGKKYNLNSQSGLSVTHEEFRTARNNNIPSIFLIDYEVISFKKVYDHNNSTNRFPEMDNPVQTFKFINEFASSAINNGYRDFKNIQDARLNIKKQLAILFGELLSKVYNPVQENIKDILSEIKTLRHELAENNKTRLDFEFLHTLRLLLDKNYKELYGLLKFINNNNTDEVIIRFIQQNNLNDYIKNLNWVVQIESIRELMSASINKVDTFHGMSSLPNHVPNVLVSKYENQIISWVSVKDKKIIKMNNLTAEFLKEQYQQIKKTAANNS